MKINNFLNINLNSQSETKKRRVKIKNISKHDKTFYNLFDDDKAKA